MEGFTVILLIAWFVLLGAYVAMYFMDKATKKSLERRASEAEQRSSQRR